MKGVNKMKKNRKKLLGLATIGAIFFLTACSSNPKKAFVDTLYLDREQAGYNTEAFSAKIKDFSYTGDEGSAYVNMIGNQLKDISIKGNTSIDKKQKTNKTNVTLSFLGQTIPVEVVGNEKKMYLATGFAENLVNVVNSFTNSAFPVDKTTIAKLKGKYLDLSDAMDQATKEAAKSADNDNALKNISPKTADVPKEKLAAEIKKTIESFDTNSFKKDGELITHTFTKAEIIKILETTNKTLKEDKNYQHEYKKANIAQDIKQMIDTLQEKNNDVKAKVSVNEKSKQTNTEVTITTSDSKSQKEKLKVILAFDSTPKKQKVAIKLPAKKEILTSDEFKTILNDLFKTNGSSSFGGTFNDETPTSDYTDKQLKTLIDAINQKPTEITEKSAQVIRQQGEALFNEQQMKQLKEALDAALQKNI